MRAQVELLSPYLDERQQRLWMGTEAREGGHGGVSLVARAAGVARSTVTRGLFELEGGEELAGRARRPAGAASAPRWPTRAWLVCCGR